MAQEEKASNSVAGPSLNHIELYVPDAAAASSEFTEHYGFQPLGDITGRNRDHRSLALSLGHGLDGSILVLTEGRTEEHPATRYVRAHDWGVADIALRTPDAAGAYRAALAAGAIGLREPQELYGAVLATIAGFGDVTHTLVQPPEGASHRWLPGFGDLAEPVTTPTGLNFVDHLAVCVDAGQLEPTVRFYQRALGFGVIFRERVEVGSQAMESTVVQNSARDVTLTIIEPDVTADPGQIDGFLERHGGAGVQHIAFATDHIVRTISVLGERGVEFLSTPDVYYDLLSRRLEPGHHSVEELRKLNLLADEDHDGQLYQVFTRSTHPRSTLFFEVIERMGAKTFGSGNIKALYEAVEAGGAIAQVPR
ncbi:4-hydroxyphenylpyruvate dioxygenase [Streptomyces sp. NPDC002476]|uniref:4-hydroxyphenylpyruvate dioxygenase n=1 Tax=Streptomyces sp. NPDC002476 TaxID=3364648 RepID=UPI0036A28E05